jgi:hypothetical protein
MYLKTIIIIFSLFGLSQSQDFQWEEPVKISNNPKGWCISPTICNDSNGNLYVAYYHYNLRESSRLYFNWFNGDSWQGVDTLYQDQNHDVYYPKLICDFENNLHMSVNISYGEYGRIYYMKKQGNKWSDLIQISVDSLGNTWDHDMVVDKSGKVYLFFHANDIYYRTYNDSTLSDPINVTNLDQNNYKAFNPKITIDPENNLYLTYLLRDENVDVTEVYYSNFDGNVWSDPVNISHFENLPSLNQDLVLDSQFQTHVVWEQRLTKLDTVLGNPTIVSYYEIFYSTNKDGNWSVPENISNIPKSSSSLPKIDIYKDQPLVFFQTSYEDVSGQEKYHSYRINEEWIVNKWDVDFNTTNLFDFIVSSSDTIHIATSSLPITQRADMEYVKGFVNPTSINPTFRTLPAALHLKNYPNPFNNLTKIQFHLDNPDNIEVNIFDITGKLVKTILKRQELNSGLQSFTWDSRNNQGNTVSSGVYFLIVTVGTKTSYQNKILLLR